MPKLQIKPLSINDAYRGRRFATKELADFKKELWYLLPNNCKVPVKATHISMIYEFGVSSKASDLDNCIKVFQDILSEKFEFNDKKIYNIIAKKVNVKKGQEYISYKIDWK